MPRRSRRQSWVFHAGGRNDLKVVIGKEEDLELAPKTEISGFWEKRRRAMRCGASPVMTLDSQENKWLGRSLLSAWGGLQNERISHIRIFFNDFHCLVILLSSQWCNYYRILFFCSWPIEILYNWVIFHFWKFSQQFFFIFPSRESQNNFVCLSKLLLKFKVKITVNFKSQFWELSLCHQWYICQLIEIIF